MYALPADVPTAKGVEVLSEQPPYGSTRSAVSDTVSSSHHLASSSSTTAMLSLSAPPLGQGASKAPSASLAAQVPQSSMSAADGVSVTPLLLSRSPRAPSQTQTPTDASPSVQTSAKPLQPIVPIPIPSPRTSGAHMHTSRSSRRSQSTITSLEGSSPEICAFLLGLSGIDVISSSESSTDSDSEQGGFPRSRSRLDTSSEESGSEGSVSRWVSSLGVSRKQRLPRFLSRAKPAPAFRPRARATGGELTVARACTPAAAITALRSTSRGFASTVRLAAALSAVAAAASLSGSRPAFTATAAPIAQAPSASLPAAAALTAMAAAAAPSAVATSP